jgi:hypothetical protein
MANITKFVLIAPLLAACAQTDATPTIQTEAVTADAAPDLARTQPEMPICAHCGADFGLETVDDDDELSMIINSPYIGNIDGLLLVVFTDSSMYTLGFDQSVIDDLNNPSTYETIVMLDVPDMERGMLRFTIDSTYHYEPITIDP